MSRWRDKQKEAKAKRDLALSRPELRDGDIFTDPLFKLPDEGVACRVRLTDTSGQHYYPKNLLACRRSCEWVNYLTGTKLAAPVVGWYQLPTQPRIP